MCSLIRDDFVDLKYLYFAGIHFTGIGGGGVELGQILILVGHHNLLPFFLF